MLIFFAILNDSLVAASTYDYFYLLEAAFLVSVSFQAVLMSDTVIQAAAAKDTLESLNEELEINHRQLEQKVAERTKEWQYQAEYFRSLFENSPIAIVTLDNNQCILQCNKAFNIMFGYETEEIIHKDLDSIIAAPSISCGCPCIKCQSTQYGKSNRHRTASEKRWINGPCCDFWCACIC